MDQDYIKLMKSNPELFRNNGEKGELRIFTNLEEIRKLEEELSTEIGILYEDKYIRLIRDAVLFPDGSSGTYIRIIQPEADSAVVILPVFERKILLLRHYRHSLRKYVWEVPRGFGEPGLTAEQNAAKELLEETGIGGTVLEYLGKVCPDSGMRGDQVAVFLTKLPIEFTLKREDEKESIIDYRLVTKQELEKLVELGEMVDGYTLSAVALAALKGRMEG